MEGKNMSSVKSIVTAFTGFLTHHIGDLNTVGNALSALLNAVPVNSGTRDDIAKAIAAAQNSANNIAAWLEANGSSLALPPVHISETDLANAVNDRVTALVNERVDSLVNERVAFLLPDAIADYLAKNPPAPPASDSAATDTKKSAAK